MKTFLYTISFLLLVSCVTAQPSTIPGRQKFPTDVNGHEVSVVYAWDAASQSFKPTGPATVIFDRMDGQNVWNVDTSTPSALNLTSTFESYGVLVKNHGSATLAIWFDLASNPTGASSPDTFFVGSGSSAFFPVSADSVYSLEKSTAPELEIQQGRVE